MSESQPYLPPPPPEPAAKRTNWKTLLGWLVLVAMFIAFYQLFSTPSPSGAPPAAPAPRPTPWLSYVLWGAVLVALAWFVSFVRASNRSAELFRRGAELMSLRKFVEAEAVYVEGRARYRFFSSLRATFDHNIGVCALYRCEFDRAVELLEQARSVIGPWTAVLRYAASSQLALVHSLRGDVDAAARLLAEAESRGAERDRSALYLPRAIIACRKGEHEQVSVDLEGRWQDLETTQTGTAMRALRLLRAYALAHLGPRGAGQVEQLIAPLRPSEPGEFAHFAAAWPEMAAFLQAHGL